jgi:hypothetical protein
MEAKPEEQALLEALINAPTQPAMATVVAGTNSTQAQPRIITKPRSRATVYDQTLEAMAYVASLGIALALWTAGAFFTLVFLEGAGVPVAPTQIFAWLIPAFVSAVELKLWPARGRSPIRGLIWFSVLAFDVGTSFAGLVQWGAGRRINLFTGITLPSTGTTLWLFALGLGLLFAFAPERIGKFAVRELRTLLKV